MPVLQAVRHVLFGIPAATKEWADIVGSLAWPATLLIILFWLRAPVRQALRALAKRLERDHLKIGGMFEITPRTEIIPLDADTNPEQQQKSDALHMEALMAAAELEAGMIRLIGWTAQNMDPTIQLVDFLTDPRYAADRAKAYQTLVQKDAE